MRKLKTADVFAFLRIAGEAHIRDEVRAIADKVAAEGAAIDAQKVGYDLILASVEGLGRKRAEAMAYEFLGGVWEMEPSAVAEMSLSEFWDTFKRWTKDYVDREEVRAFFGALSSWMR